MSNAAIEAARKVAEGAFPTKKPGVMMSVAVMGSTVILLGEHGEAIFICGPDLSKLAMCCQIADGVTGQPAPAPTKKRRK